MEQNDFVATPDISIKVFCLIEINILISEAHTKHEKIYTYIVQQYLSVRQYPPPLYLLN